MQTIIIWFLTDMNPKLHTVSKEKNDIYQFKLFLIQLNKAYIKDKRK